MGTTRKRLAEQTRAGILIMVARVLFMSQDSQGASTRAIAEKCGIIYSNLYHHFGNKQQLFKQVIEDLVAEIEIIQKEIVAKDLPSAAKLEEMMGALVEAHPANFFRMMDAIKGQLSDDNPREVDQLYN